MFKFFFFAALSILYGNKSPDLVKSKPPQYLLFLVDNLVSFFKYLEHQLFEAILEC